MAVETTKQPVSTPSWPVRTRDFVGEVSDEMKKVTWPDWPQLKNATLVIIVFVLIVAAIIWGMDQIVNIIIGPRGLLRSLLG
jgi:preprotein translocase subunit SecE